MPSVLFVTRYLAHYRVAFHEAVRKNLARNGVIYRLAYGAPHPSEAVKNEPGKLAWAEETPVICFGRSDSLLCWQCVVREARQADLVIVGQENRLLVNYLLQSMRAVGGPPIAFFGHGRNFQSANPDSRAERFKRFWVNKVDWWFAYTQGVADIVRATGFPTERITVFNNSTDTSSMVAELATISRAERDERRNALFEGSSNVGVYVGGLYPMKRIGFLITASERVREIVSDFHLLVIGGGPDAPIAKAAARCHPWVHYAGQQIGREKSALVSLAKVFLMPGAVGLAVLDSFAYGIPMVTTDYPFHGPEIEYLKHGVNGLKTARADDAGEYADAVARVLTNEAEFENLQTGMKAALEKYSIEAMVAKFSAGVLGALQSGFWGR